MAGDREVVLAAVKQSGSALKHASGELKSDFQFVLALLQHDETLAAEWADPKTVQAATALVLSIQDKDQRLAAQAAEIKALEAQLAAATGVSCDSDGGNDGNGAGGSS